MPCQLIKINKLTQQIFYFIFFNFQKLYQHKSKTQSHNRDSRRRFETPI